MSNCSVDGCSRPQKYVMTGWCQTHYHRYWRTGSIDDPKPRPIDWWAPVTYRCVHERIERTFGKASLYTCFSCGSMADEWAYDGTDPTHLEERPNGRKYLIGYSRFPEFYAPMCFGCHRLMDHGRWSRARTRCGNGHELTVENTYYPPGKGGRSRQCVTCRRDECRERARIRRAELKALGLTARGTLPRSRRCV